MAELEQIWVIYKNPANSYEGSWRELIEETGYIDEIVRPDWADEYYRQVFDESEKARAAKRYKFTLRDILKYANRGRKAAQAAVPGAIGELIVEAAVIAAVKYLMEKETLTPEERALAVEIQERAKNTPYLTEYGQILYTKQDSTPALSQTDSILLGGQPLQAWEPTPVPVPVQTPDGIKVETSQKPNELEFNLTAETFNQPIKALDFSWDFAKLEDVRTLPIEDIVTIPDGHLVTRIMQLPLSEPILDTDLAIDFDAVIDALPVAMPQTSLSLDPNLATQLKFKIRVNPRQQGETNRRRIDKKSKSAMAYLAALKFINQTWGRITEIDDFVTAATSNLIYEKSTTICTENGCIVVRPGQDLKDLPLEYRVQAVQNMILETNPGVTMDWEGFMFDYAKMQATDVIIGLLVSGERKLIDKYKLRDKTAGLTDYGNISTWYNRLQKAINGETDAIFQTIHQ